MKDRYIFKNFWGLSASVLGSYEAMAFVSGKRTPTLSNYYARRRSTRAMLVAWTLGLAFHIWKHEVDLTAQEKNIEFSLERKETI